MTSLHVPFHALGATCGWKRRLSTQFLLLLVSVCLLSSCTMADHESPEMPDCSRQDAQTPADCVLGRTTFNNETCTCNPCSQCNREEMFMISECTLFQDAQCDCNSPLFYDTTDSMCRIDCLQCPLKECLSRTACACLDQGCHLPGDKYCRDPILCITPITIPTTPSTQPPPGPFDNETFPAWGIGLIAIGIVIGIIIFASCFLCMGLFSMHKNRDPESQGSEASDSGLVPRESFASVGTSSSYVSSGSLYPYLNSQNMLELLRSSNSQLGKPNMSRLSSLQSSPISSRGSPKPGRTVKLTKSPGSAKLTAIVVQ